MKPRINISSLWALAGILCEAMRHSGHSENTQEIIGLQADVKVQEVEKTERVLAVTFDTTSQQTDFKFIIKNMGPSIENDKLWNSYPLCATQFHVVSSHKKCRRRYDIPTSQRRRDIATCARRITNPRFH